MNKVMVEINIPVTGTCYDVLLPKTLSMSQATSLLAGFFTGLTGGAYMPDQDTVLCSMDDGRIYNVNSSVEDLHLQNGSKLMLI